MYLIISCQPSANTIVKLSPTWLHRNGNIREGFIAFRLAHHRRLIAEFDASNAVGPAGERDDRHQNLATFAINGPAVKGKSSIKRGLTLCCEFNRSTSIEVPFSDLSHGMQIFTPHRALGTNYNLLLVPRKLCDTKKFYCHRAAPCLCECRAIGQSDDTFLLLLYLPRRLHLSLLL